MRLDLSDVTHCDSAGMALLIEARKLCKKNNKIFEIIGMSSEIQSLADFCGVKEILAWNPFSPRGEKVPVRADEG